MKKIIPFVVLALFLPDVAHASGEPDAFALPGVGARPAGMGGAFIGLSDEIESVYYNPAGLGNLIQNEITGMYQTPYLDTTRSFFAANKRWSSPTLPGSVAFGWLRMHTTDIELTNSDENILGSDSLSNDLFMLAAGVHPLAHWSAGVSLKYYRFAFNGFEEGGLGYDVGVHAQYNPLRVGCVLTDLGGTRLSGNSVGPSGGKVTDHVPARFRPGVALSWPEPFNWPIHVSTDLDELIKLQGSQDIQYYGGAEVWGFSDRAALRAGYQQSNGPSFGFSGRFGFFELDYSYMLSLHLKDEHRISTTFRI
jgi:hypothetical protein